ncbi:hypothetical protein ACU686_30920 [Yinghuangia aomiensis]
MSSAWASARLLAAYGLTEVVRHRADVPPGRRGGDRPPRRPAAPSTASNWSPPTSPNW